MYIKVYKAVWQITNNELHCVKYDTTLLNFLICIIKHGFCILVK